MSNKEYAKIKRERERVKRRHRWGCWDRGQLLRWRSTRESVENVHRINIEVSRVGIRMTAGRMENSFCQARRRSVRSNFFPTLCVPRMLSKRQTFSAEKSTRCCRAQWKKEYLWNCTQNVHSFEFPSAHDHCHILFGKSFQRCGWEIFVFPREKEDCDVHADLDIFREEVNTELEHLKNSSTIEKTEMRK